MTRSRRQSGVLRAFERAYRKALSVPPDAGPSVTAASRIAKRAAGSGTTVLDLARIHERATAALPGARALALRRDAFFADVVRRLAAAMSARSTGRDPAAERRKAELKALRARCVRATELARTWRRAAESERRQHAALATQSEVMQTNMRRLSHRLLSAQEEERMRISRDLHDAIGQTLTGINVGLATLKQSATHDARDIAEAITTTQRLVERSMKTVHQFAWELRPTLLDDLGLVPALRSYAKTFSERTGLRVRLDAPARLAQLDVPTNTALFRVAQGALSNVERHARAGRARIVIRAAAGMLRLEVRDDGRAFDVVRMSRSRRNKHLGLLVMRERIEMVGGVFAIESVAGRGTTVRADVPLVGSPDA